MANLEALEDYITDPKPGTVLEWYGSWTIEEQALLRQVILNNAAAEVLPALQKNADFPFSITALKSLKRMLREEKNGGILD